jgi:DNA (cytosine-5)-methyltransferase 1
MSLDVALAVDTDTEALNVYSANFPKAETSLAPVQSFFNGSLGSKHTTKETVLLRRIGAVHAIIGGPPCQGHSDLNNHTRRDDPKNELYLRLIRAAEVFRPSIVLIENVPTVRRSKVDVVTQAREVLTNAGYQVAEEVISVAVVGVPQTRRRHVLLATYIPSYTPTKVFEALTLLSPTKRGLRWAIGDLATIREPAGFDAAPRASAENKKRMQWMLDHRKWDLPNRLRPKCHQDGDHSYKAMYGRLEWGKPAQTITSGFTSIGQGRYMHPSKARALTHHEAARIQGFPDYFDFSATTRRTSLATMIGNAVPPALSKAIFLKLVPSIAR